MFLQFASINNFLKRSKKHQNCVCCLNEGFKEWRWRLQRFSNIGCQEGENILKYPILDNLHSSRHFQIHIEFPILPFRV